MRKQLILSLVLGIILIGIVSAENNINVLPLPQNQPWVLTVNSNNATSCSLTYIQYPDGTQTIFNAVMTQNETTWYVNIPAVNYKETGIICHGVSCTDGTDTITENICREITASGKGIDPIDEIIIWFAIYVLAFIFLIRNDDEQLEIIGWTAWVINAIAGGVIIQSTIALFFSMLVGLISVYNIYQYATKES